MNDGSNVFDFAHVPTVNGTPLAEAHPGIQRITTTLPLQTETVLQDATISYTLYISTTTAVPNDITVHLFSEEVGSLDNVNLPNNHLGIGDNTFTFTLTGNQFLDGY